MPETVRGPRSSAISADVNAAARARPRPLDRHRSINAPIESFFHTLKVELVHQRWWATRDEARRDLFAYIEGYYNRQRLHSALGYRTPEQAEQRGET